MTKDQIVKRFDAMDAYARSNWMDLWQECADWAWPTNDNINRVRTVGEEKNPQRMIDTCIEANFNFASGYFSNFYPPNTVWAKFKHTKPKMMQNRAIANYFEEVSRIIHMVMLGSNFASEEFQALLAIGCFGTSCLSVEKCEKNVVRFRNININRIRIDEDYKGMVDTVAREFELTARQAIQQFGEKALVKAGLEQIPIEAENGKDTKYKFIHFVSPRKDFNPKKRDNKNKPYSSYYICREGEGIVKEGGFSTLPYKVSRFVNGNDEIYGRGPMSMKLATTRRTNVIYRASNVSAEMHINGQWLVPDDDSVTGISSRAGAIIKYRATNPNGKPERLPANGDPQLGIELFKFHEEEIKRMFFNHLFRPLDDRQNMTAYEANERVTSDLMQLAPFIGRYTDEKVSPMMQEVFRLCDEAGILPEPPQEIIDSPNMEIDYVGRLALATKNFEVAGAIDTLRILIELGSSAPQLMEVLDNFDIDKLAVDIWYAKSSSLNALIDPDIRDENRAIRAEQAQKQQQMEALPAMADAAQKMSGAVDPTSIVANQGK